MFSKPVLKDLEDTFGRIPQLISEHQKYLSYDETKHCFTCKPCVKSITKIDDPEALITKRFNQHLHSTGHKKKTTPESEIWQSLINTFKGEIPQIVKTNFNLIDTEGDDFYCFICYKTIQTSVDISKTSNNFSYHLTGKIHEDNLEKYRELVYHLHDIYGGIPRFIMSHHEFLIKIASDTYQCTLCEKKLKVHPTDCEITEKEFDKHLHSVTHARNSKQAKAFSLIPDLKIIFPRLPHYILRNIEHISMNGSNFFCSLCNENIVFNKHDAFETEHNFKVHFSQSTHEDKLSERNDYNNEVFSLLESCFGGLPMYVIGHLKYISIEGNEYCCNVCMEVVTEDDADSDDIKDDLISHCTSSEHEANIDSNKDQHLEILQDLNDVFGSVPELIKDNIMHIEFKGGITFECTLCKKTLQSKNNSDYDSNSSVTEENFEKHLNSFAHEAKLKSLAGADDEVESELENLFFPIPQFIINNLQHLGVEDDSGGFHCYLCDDTVAVVNGTKKSELTEQNLRMHIFSAGHIANLKHQANLETKALHELELIFGKVPSVVMSGIEHLQLQENSFICNLCDVEIKTSAQSLTNHFYGQNHRSCLKTLENDHSEAFTQLDRRFWRVPEFLLNNIDFLLCDGEDLFCILCQENLPLDRDDLEVTKQDLKYHMNSKAHQSNLKSN